MHDSGLSYLLVLNNAVSAYKMVFAPTRDAVVDNYKPTIIHLCSYLCNSSLGKVILVYRPQMPLVSVNIVKLPFTISPG